VSHRGYFPYEKVRDVNSNLPTSIQDLSIRDFPPSPYLGFPVA